MKTTENQCFFMIGAKVTGGHWGSLVNFGLHLEFFIELLTVIFYYQVKRC